MKAMLHTPFEPLAVSGETLTFDTTSLSDVKVAEMRRHTITVTRELSVTADRPAGA